MTFNEQRRRWEGGPQVDLSGFGDDVNPRRTSKSADDAKEDADAGEELQATLLEAEKRRDGELERFWGGAPSDNGENDAAAVEERRRGAGSARPLSKRRRAGGFFFAPEIAREGRRLVGRRRRRRPS